MNAWRAISERSAWTRLPNGARYAGLAGLKNGELLTAAETAGFEVFLTVDQGIEYQQNLLTRKSIGTRLECSGRPHLEEDRPM
jgi:hypothetical protein